MLVGVYCRVSTQDQSSEMQLSDLRRYCEQRNFKIYREYRDEGVSGIKNSRPGLNELMADARKRKFDAIMCWRFDRFARSTKHLINALEEFHHLGIEFISFQENIDTSSPLGKAMFTIVSAISELERNIIVERIRGGLRRAREQGIKLGRRPKIDTELLGILRDMRDKGMSIREISKALGLSKSCVHKTLKFSWSKTLEKSTSDNKGITVL